jgi:hypothetical protein
VANASAVVASGETVAHAVRAAGGVSPDGASDGVPKSMTRATRFLPSDAGVFAQIVVKDAVPRGFVASDESSLTAKRRPWTSPSEGTAVAGPWVA